MRLKLGRKVGGHDRPRPSGAGAYCRRAEVFTTNRTPAWAFNLGLLQQINSLTDWFTQRAAYKEKALTQRGLTVQAGEHSEQIFTRWRAGAYDGWSLPGRCFVALEELRWGAFGDACRLANADVVLMLKDNLRTTGRSGVGGQRECGACYASLLSSLAPARQLSADRASITIC